MKGPFNNDLIHSRLHFWSKLIK